MKTKKQTKKEIKLTAKEYHIKFLKENLEHIKRVYEVYIEALAKYNMKSLPYSAMMSEDYLQNEIIRRMEILRKNKKGMSEWMFGNPGRSEEEKIKEETEYYDSLIKTAQGKFEMMEHDIKIQIAKDAVEKSHAWLKLSGENYKEIKR